MKTPLTKWFEHVQEFDGHWLWNGRMISDVPMFWAKANGRSRYRSARRVMWTYLNGPLPPGRNVKNSCGVKACVHPAHCRVVELP